MGGGREESAFEVRKERGGRGRYTRKLVKGAEKRELGKGKWRKGEKEKKRGKLE
jgi:hypothetical protein